MTTRLYSNKGSSPGYVDTLYPRGHSSSWDTDTTHTANTPSGDSSTFSSKNDDTPSVQHFGRFLGESDHSDEDSETSVEFELRTAKESFHLEDSWMIVPPEEEVVFGTDSDESTTSDERFLSFDSGSEDDEDSYTLRGSAQEKHPVFRNNLYPSIEDSDEEQCLSEDETRSKALQDVTKKISYDPPDIGVSQVGDETNHCQVEETPLERKVDETLREMDRVRAEETALDANESEKARIQHNFVTKELADKEQRRRQVDEEATALKEQERHATKALEAKAMEKGQKQNETERRLKKEIDQQHTSHKLELNVQEKAEAVKLTEKELKVKVSELQAFEEKPRQHEALKLLEEEKKPAEVVTEAFTQTFKANQAKSEEEEKKREAATKASETQALKDKQRERGQNQLDVDRKNRQGEAEVIGKVLEKKDKEEEKKQHKFDEKKPAEEERRQHTYEAKALEAKKLEEERVGGELEKKRKVDEEKMTPLQIEEVDETSQHKVEAETVEATSAMEDKRREGKRQLEANPKHSECLRRLHEEQTKTDNYKDKGTKEEKGEDPKQKLFETEKTVVTTRKIEEKQPQTKTETVVTFKDERRNVTQTIALPEETQDESKPVESETKEGAIEESCENFGSKNTKEEERRSIDNTRKMKNEARQTEGQQSRREADVKICGKSRCNKTGSITTTSLVSNLAVTAVAVGLAAVGSRIDGNIKVCQSSEMLELGIVIDTTESMKALRDVSKNTLDSMDIDIQRSIQGLRDISKNTVDNIDIDIKGSIQSLRDTWKNTLDSISSDGLNTVGKLTTTSATTSATRMVSNLAFGVAASPAAYMVGNLASTAVAVGLAAVGSRIDGNIKVCQSPGKLHLGIIID